jgi:hypothetical protein
MTKSRYATVFLDAWAFTIRPIFSILDGIG